MPDLSKRQLRHLSQQRGATTNNPREWLRQRAAQQQDALPVVVKAKQAKHAASAAVLTKLLQNMPRQVAVVKGRQMGRTTQMLDELHKNLIMPKMINDAFFTSTPLQHYMRSRAPQPFGFGEDDGDVLQIHEPGHLCWDNPACEECYA